MLKHVVQYPLMADHVNDFKTSGNFRKKFFFQF